MKAIGAHVKIQDSRYLVGLVVVEDGRVGDGLTLPAPADRDVAGQLDELYEWVADIVAQQSPEDFAIRVAELSAGAALDLARRAEGAILAGARHGGAPTCSLWSRQLLSKPLTGAGQAKAKEIRDAVGNHVDRVPSSAVLVEAVCAAVACGAGW